MAVFVTTKQAARRHGVYAIERNPPAIVRATGTSKCYLVGQFPWGPAQTAFEPGSMAELISTVAPAGFDRTGSAYLSMIRKAWPGVLNVVRVLGPAAAVATATINKTGPVAMLTVTAKYPGATANSFVATTSAATDGDANHFNLKVEITGASGTTTEVFENLNYSGVGADSVPSFVNTLLVGGITKLASGVPLLTTASFTGGTNGTVTAAEYVGTAGTGDKGFAKLEGLRDVDHVACDDPGNTIRAAVNSGAVGHAELMKDRMVWICGPTAQSSAAVKIDVALYRSLYVGYVDAWPSIFDDVDGTLRQVPPAPFAMSVAAQLSPSTSIAWKDTKVIGLLSGIVSLEVDRGEAAATNTENGIITLCREPGGGFSFEAGVNSAAPLDPRKRTITRTRMGLYIAKSIVTSLRPFTDSPNVPYNQQDEIQAVEEFMGGLKRNATTDPNNLPHVLDFDIGDLAAVNNQTDLDNGEFTIPLDAKISSSQEKIFLSLQYGESVKITANL